MSYTRRNFVDGSTPAIDADNLNAMDVAIKAHDDRLAALASVDGTSDANKPISTAAAAALALKADLVAGKIPVDQIPSIAMQTPFSAASESEMLALDAQTGDVCIRSDTKATYMLGAMPASALANWLLMTVTADPLLPNQNQKNALAGTGSPSAGNPFVTQDTLTNGYGYFHDWNASKSYGLNEPVFYNGVPYKSLIVSNINNQPDVSPTQWQVTGFANGIPVATPPIGAVYFQGVNDPDPATLYPSTIWSDVSWEEANCTRRVAGSLAGSRFTGVPAQLSVSVGTGGAPTINVVSGGSGYLSGGTGTLALTIVGACTTQMVATANVTSGVITTISVGTPGAGYTADAVAVYDRVVGHGDLSQGHNTKIVSSYGSLQSGNAISLVSGAGSSSGIEVNGSRAPLGNISGGYQISDGANGTPRIGAETSGAWVTVTKWRRTT